MERGHFKRGNRGDIFKELRHHLSIMLDKADVRMLRKCSNWEFLINGATPDGEFLGSLKNDIWSALSLSVGVGRKR